MKSLTLVIPCWNESRRLVVGDFLDALRWYPFLKFVFVDDGSSDDTAEILAYLEHASPSVHACYLPKNVGKAEAVREGVNWALEHTDSEAIGFWDADLATPFSELPAFVKELDEDPSCETVVGARWPHLGSQIDRNVFRHCTGGLMKTLIRFVLRAPVYDTQCGAKVFRRECAKRVFSRPFHSRWLFDVEILKRIGKDDMLRSVHEVPLSYWRDVRGTKLGFLDSMRLLPDLMRIAVA